MGAAWDWIVAAYERPGVPQICLTLQDEHGQNTSFLLWAVWAGGADPDLLDRGARAARTWDQTALGPLRSVRRALKAPLEPVPDAAREGLRDDVKAAELRAERVLVETLEALSGARTGAAACEVLASASRAWGRTAPNEALAALAEALR